MLTAAGLLASLSLSLALDLSDPSRSLPLHLSSSIYPHVDTHLNAEGTQRASPSDSNYTRVTEALITPSPVQHHGHKYSRAYLYPEGTHVQYIFVGESFFKTPE
jgi:hypothetical protein